MMKKNILQKSQQGISLYVVLIIILLSSLLTLWASRTALFNELVLGNDVDYQRAFEAAQVILQDAELDIRGVRSDGALCQGVGGNLKICRPVGAKISYPLEDQELGNFFNELAVAKNSANVVTGCIEGICVKRTGSQDFWVDKNTLDNMILSAARYGEFTGAPRGASTSKTGNPILNNNTLDQGAWYWVEVMPYDPNADKSGLIQGASSNLALNLKPSVVYRITALARGIKPGTQVVLQSTFVRQKLKN